MDHRTERTRRRSRDPDLAETRKHALFEWPAQDRPRKMHGANSFWIIEVGYRENESQRFEKHFVCGKLHVHGKLQVLRRKAHNRQHALERRRLTLKTAKELGDESMMRANWTARWRQEREMRHNWANIAKPSKGHRKSSHDSQQKRRKLQRKAQQTEAAAEATSPSGPELSPRITLKS